MALVAELESIRQQTDAISARAKISCNNLNEEQLSWRPGPTSWSIAENLLHLDRTTQIFLPVIDRAIGDARRDGHLSNGPFRLGIMGKVYVWYSEPPPRIRLSAPKALTPFLEGSASSALSQFLNSQELMKQRFANANGIDIVRTRITSPFASFVKMSLFALFSVFAAHERRHIWQASNVLAQLDSRSSP